MKPVPAVSGFKVFELLEKAVGGADRAAELLDFVDEVYEVHGRCI